MTLANDQQESTASDSQRVLDARMEYEQLLVTIRTIEQMWWVDVGAFFAVNTLLATAFGVSLSAPTKDYNVIAMNAVHLLIPLTGVFFSYVAIRTANILARLGRLTVERGIELENILFARIFVRLQSNYERPPWATRIASLFFLAIWLAAGAAAVKFTP